MTILNLGCGTKAANAENVVNIDWSIYLRLRSNPLGRLFATVVLRGSQRKRFEAVPPNIIAHDIARGIPFPDCSVEAVYHSHFLEHLERDAAPDFLAEVRRVLRNGGVHRIVVPDFAQLCATYMIHLERVRGCPAEAARHDEYVSAIVEQMVRGEAYSTRRQRPARRFIENLLLGDARRRGETHQWMYDAVNLRVLLETVGFEDVAIYRHDTSTIPGWNALGLDRNEAGDEYKPGSLYIEARKRAE